MRATSGATGTGGYAAADRAKRDGDDSPGSESCTEAEEERGIAGSRKEVGNRYR
jgi:hypothetical protein